MMSQLQQLPPRRSVHHRPRRTAIGLLSLVGLLGSLLASSPAFGTGHTVSGTAKYSGEDFRLRAIRMNADPNCEKLHSERVLQDDKIVNDDGGVANVFVYLKESPDGVHEAPAEPVELTQEGCMYKPKVAGILVKQNLDVINEDPTLHNVRCLARSNRPFNLGQPSKGKRTKFFTKPEAAVKFKCDVHPWMSAYLFVMEHPYFATTDDSGSFSISNVPAGKHTLVAWHESFGELEMEIEVSADKGDIVFDFE